MSKSPKRKSNSLFRSSFAAHRRRVLGWIYHLFGKAGPGISRLFFVVVIFFGFIWYAVYTNFIFERLNNYSRATTEIYAQLISEALYDKVGDFAEHIILEQIIQDFDMPIIITDMMGRPRIWKNITVGHFFWERRIEQKSNCYETTQILLKEIDHLKKRYEPKLIYGRDKRTRMGFLYYGDSTFLNGLALLPYFEILFVIFFIAMVYLVLRSFLVIEKSNLWVGLAKETAHQLGTPLSSLFGWLEYLQIECRALREEQSYFGDEENEFSRRVEDITHDMSRDVARINKVANRFSLIGSLPVLEKENLQQLLDDHIAYFSKRLPTLGKKVTIDYVCDDIPPVTMNSDLMSWVFENLFKNALDAIDDPLGTIQLRVVYIVVDKVIRITHRDTGKGIPWDNRNAVFNPGFTTKRRGWGLGLTLARRIVEEYHGGKIYISWSQKDKGTEFVVELPISGEEI